MMEAQCALAYLPAEDKINLALGLVTAPVIADPSESNTMRDIALEAQNKVDEMALTITALNAQIAANKGTKKATKKAK